MAKIGTSSLAYSRERPIRGLAKISDIAIVILADADTEPSFAV